MPTTCPLKSRDEYADLFCTLHTQQSNGMIILIELKRTQVIYENSSQLSTMAGLIVYFVETKTIFSSLMNFQ